MVPIAKLSGVAKGLGGVNPPLALRKELFLHIVQNK